MDARGRIHGAELVAAPQIFPAFRIPVERIHTEAAVAVPRRLDSDDAVADASGGDHDTIILVGLARPICRAWVTDRGEDITIARRYRRVGWWTWIAETTAAGEASEVNPRIGIA